MLELKDIYGGAERLINQILKQELAHQGHTLTGALDDSLSARISETGKTKTLIGEAVKYADFVNDGFPAESASFKQAPFLIKYFESRGYPYYASGGQVSAVQLAFATIKKWMKEGMSTQASKRFSQTGSRQNFIQNAFTGYGPDIDEYVTNNFDLAVEEKYRQTKNETV